MNKICKVCEMPADLGRRHICEPCRKQLKMRDDHGHLLPTRASRKRLTTDEITTIVAMIDSGMNDFEVARRLGLADSTVRHLRNRLGIAVVGRRYQSEAVA